MLHCACRSGNAVARSVERTTPCVEVLGLISPPPTPPPWPPATYWLGRCQYNVTGWDRRHGLPALPRVWKHVNLSVVSLGTGIDIAWLLTSTLRNQPNKRIKLVDLLYRRKILDIQKPHEIICDDRFSSLKPFNSRFALFEIYLKAIFFFKMLHCLACI